MRRRRAAAASTRYVSDCTGGARMFPAEPFEAFVKALG